MKTILKDKLFGPKIAKIWTKTIEMTVILGHATPTSVVAERAFSSTELFVTKIRSRLNDESMSTIFKASSLFLLVGQSSLELPVYSQVRKS